MHFVQINILQHTSIVSTKPQSSITESDQRHHHCSPTSTDPFFFPLLLAAPALSNRSGEKCCKLSVELVPVATSSATARPLAGAHRIPQQLCPHEMYAPSTSGTFPITGKPSDGQGLMHACHSDNG